MDGLPVSLLRRLAAAARTELSERILPFWLALEDPLHGGHFETMDAQGRIYPNEPKTAVFQSRLLWTMTEAARRLGCVDCAGQAHRSYHFIERLRDPGDRGGYFAAVTRDGTPFQLHRHIYAQAFVLFGLAGYAAATGDAQARARALDQFRTIEDRAHDRDTGLYHESFDEAWRTIPNADRALGEAVAPYTADTHLHLVEAYTQLFRVAPLDEVRAALRGLVETFLARFVAPDGAFAHQKLDHTLTPVPGTIWPGHDIEASWLLATAGDLLGDADLAAHVRGAARRLAQGAIRHGADANGGWTERVRNGARDPARLWWVQAEAVVGTLSEGLRSGDPQMIEQADATWSFIERCISDKRRGDWRLRVGADGTPDEAAPRVIFWKDAYHQARACMELAERCAAAAGPS